MRVSVVRERRDRLRRTESSPALPRAYFVPRAGQLVRVVAELRDDLCDLRGELELLRRIRRRLAAPPAPQSPPDPHPRNIDELIQILRDAQHPIVDEMVSLLDREFPDVREEVAMSVINEESEDIVQAAVDSGAVELAAVRSPADLPTADVPTAVASPGEEVVTGGPTPISASAAADDAQVEPGLTAAQTATQIEAALAEAEAALAGVIADSDATLEHGTACDAALADLPRTSADTAARETPGGASVDSCPPTRRHAPKSNTPKRPVDNGVVALSRSADAHTPERAMQAVSQIEQGVRKLSSLLGAEVDDQWRRASGALDELVQAREQAAELTSAARGSLEAILALRADAEAARNDAEAIRQEARSLRDETQRARHRAETAAAAAELAADQAARECAVASHQGATATQTYP